MSINDSFTMTHEDGVILAATLLTKWLLATCPFVENTALAIKTSEPTEELLYAAPLVQGTLLVYVTNDCYEHYLQLLQEHRVSVIWPPREGRPATTTVVTLAEVDYIKRHRLDYSSMKQLTPREVTWLLLTGKWGQKDFYTEVIKEYPQFDRELTSIWFHGDLDSLLVREGWEADIEQLTAMDNGYVFGSPFTPLERRVTQYIFSEQQLRYAAAHAQQFA